MGFTVRVEHLVFGTVNLKHVTEIHYLYSFPLGNRVAFESNIEGDGVVYDVGDVLEFEAKLD